MSAIRRAFTRASVIALFAVATGMTGCTVPIGAPLGSTTPLRPVTVLEARRTLRTTDLFGGRQDGRDAGYNFVLSGAIPRGGGQLANVTVRPSGLTFVASADRGRRDAESQPLNSVTCDFDTITPRAEQVGNRLRIHFGTECGVETVHTLRDQATVERVVDALIVLRQHARGVIASGASEAEFAEAVRYYRSQPSKPALPESARRHAVHAAAAARAKDYGQAIDSYAEALTIAPWWPEGYFNRALLLAEAGVYGAAIGEMKRYLALAPDAPDARAAQDKIYEWEGLARARPAAKAPARR